MKVIDCSLIDLSLSELLKLAIEDTLLLKSPDGQEFVVVQVDDFEEEVKSLGQSERFMKFLEERSQEKTRYSLGEVKQRLGIE
jgi:hypothetical protein